MSHHPDVCTCCDERDPNCVSVVITGRERFPGTIYYICPKCIADGDAHGALFAAAFMRVLKSDPVLIGTVHQHQHAHHAKETADNAEGAAHLLQRLRDSGLRDVQCSICGRPFLTRGTETVCPPCGGCNL